MFKNIEYWETDPSIKTYKGLKKIKKFLRLNDNYKQFNKPFEELELPENYFDFAFTSPPYFNTELYADEQTQSHIKFKQYEQWRDNFLFKLIDNTLLSLKHNGKMLLNIGNKKYDFLTDTINYVQSEYPYYNIIYVDNFNLTANNLGFNKKREDDKGEKFIEITKKGGN